MCEWGTDTLLLVPIPAGLSHTGQFRWAIRGIDACIADLVQALNEAGLYTANCCCGHNKGPGIISLHDGRALIVCDSVEEAERLQYGEARPARDSTRSGG